MIKVKGSKKEQDKIDTIQPYLPNGKRNAKFEKFYGSIDDFENPKWKHGEAQQGIIDESAERQKHSGRKSYSFPALPYK